MIKNITNFLFILLALAICIVPTSATLNALNYWTKSNIVSTPNPNTDITFDFGQSKYLHVNNTGSTELITVAGFSSKNLNGVLITPKPNSETFITIYTVPK